MKKVIIITVIVLVFVGGIGAAIFAVVRNGSSTTSDSTPTPHASASAAKTVTACDILTQAIAEELLGKDINKIDSPAAASATSDPTISSCNYMTKANTTDQSSSLPKASFLSLMVYSAKSATGKSFIELEFKKATGVQAVKGYGDKAQYDTQFKQLHVLKGNNLYSITYAKDSVSNSSLESDKELADKLNLK